jgi:hypothetical protein
LKELERVSNKLCGNGSKCLEILNNDQFDVLYSIVYYVEELSLKVRKEFITLLQIGLKNCKHYIDMRKMWEYSENNLLTSTMLANQETMLDSQFKIILLIQNAIKAYTYLITWFMSENSKLKDGRDVISKRKKKNAT